MAELQDVRYGWDFMAKLLGADLGSQSAYADFAAAAVQNQHIAAQNLRIQEINAAIDELARSINEHPHLHLGVEQFKGYVAEEQRGGYFALCPLPVSRAIWTLAYRKPMSLSQMELKSTRRCISVVPAANCWRHMHSAASSWQI